MNHNPTVDREFFHKLLASAFVVQQSQVDSQSRAAIVELGRLITSGELDVDAAMHARKISNTTGAARDTLSGSQLPLLGLEGDRSTGAYLSPLARMLATHDTGDLLTETALDPALSDTAAIAETVRLLDLSCAVERSTSPPSDEPNDATYSSDAGVAALRLRAPEVKIAPLPSRDPWTPLLGIMAIALAFLLGWMLGHGMP